MKHYLSRYFPLRFALAIMLGFGLVGCQKTSSTSEGAKETYVSSRKGIGPAFLALPRDETIDMLNMIRFKELADYEPGSGFEDKGWTGAQAYAEYSRRSQTVIDRMDAEIIYAGDPAMTMIGPADEQWDAIFILRYKDLATFGALMKDPEYRAHAFHRKAAVEDSRLVRLAPAAKTMPTFN